MSPPSDVKGLSPFAIGGAKLAALGYSPIPITPGEKTPGLYAGGAWRMHRGWNRYCREVPTAFQIKLWASWPNAGLGVACGRGLFAFDIDRDALVEPLRAVLPEPIVAKKGRKGETLFYRGDTTRIRSRGFKIDGLGVMDLISDGKQTVLPPSVHPISGLSYEWTTERTLLDTPLADLTEVTDEHAQRVIAVLVEHGYDPKLQTFPTEGEVHVESVSQSSDFFRRLNEDALANLDAWVPRLNLARCVRQSGGYRAVAEWRASNSGNPIHKRPLLLSFNPKGIIDYGDGDKPYTALNVVMKRDDLSEWQIDQAAKWLGECLGYDFSERIVLTSSKSSPPVEDSARGTAEIVEPEESRAPITSKHAPPPEADETEGPIEIVAARTPRDMTKAERERALEELTLNTPGLLGDLVDWIVKSSRRPTRILAYSAAICALGVLAGQRYESETRLRTNIYTLGLAPSGFGKDHAMKCVDGLITTAGLESYLGGSDIMSGSGMRARVEAKQAIHWQIDEFGGFWRKINDARSPHTHAIRDMLLKMFSTAADTYRGADYAGVAAAPIRNPNVCIYGASTPDDFWRASSSLAVADGLIARFLIFTVGSGAPPERVQPVMSMAEPPKRLIDAIRELTRPPRGSGNLQGATNDNTTAIKPRCVRFAEGAHNDFTELEDHYLRVAGSYPSEVSALWNRAAEHTLKIALIEAIGRDLENPMIYPSDLTRAAELVDLCICGAIEEISGRIADNDRQREYLIVKRMIAEAGEGGITNTGIARKVNGLFDTRRMDEILRQLSERAGEIAFVRRATKGRPSTRWVLARYAEGEDKAA